MWGLDFFGCRCGQIARGQVHRGGPRVEPSAKVAVLLHVLVAPGIGDQVGVILVVVVQVFGHPCL